MSIPVLRDTVCKVHLGTVPGRSPPGPEGYPRPRVRQLEGDREGSGPEGRDTDLVYGSPEECWTVGSGEPWLDGVEGRRTDQRTGNSGGSGPGSEDQTGNVETQTGSRRDYAT